MSSATLVGDAQTASIGRVTVRHEQLGTIERCALLGDVGVGQSGGCETRPGHRSADWSAPSRSKTRACWTTPDNGWPGSSTFA